jgi:hypothetical protein
MGSGVFDRKTSLSSFAIIIFMIGGALYVQGGAFHSSRF